jgi:hypothetical protein
MMMNLHFTVAGERICGNLGQTKFTSCDWLLAFLTFGRPLAWKKIKVSNISNTSYWHYYVSIIQCMCGSLTVLMQQNQIWEDILVINKYNLKWVEPKLLWPLTVICRKSVFRHFRECFSFKFTSITNVKPEVVVALNRKP